MSSPENTQTIMQYMKRSRGKDGAFDPNSLIEKAESTPTTPYMKFDNLLHNNGRRALYSFVEGKDECDFYIHRVAMSGTGDNSLAIPYGNKDNVINTKQYIDVMPIYDDCKLLYFVDRDYDSVKNIKARSLGIFVTDGYSVENYYCSDQFIRNFAVIIANESDAEIQESLVKLFTEWRENLVIATKPFCAWLRAAYNRPMSKNAKDKHKKSFPSKYAEISSSGIVPKQYDYQILNSDYGLERPVTDTEFEESMEAINGIEDIRGKFVIQCVESFIEHVRINIGRKDSILKKEFSFPLNRKTILARLSKCADTSESIVFYIKDKTS